MGRFSDCDKSQFYFLNTHIGMNTVIIQGMQT